MDSWKEVVTNPIGLGGFALFLVFSFLGKKKKHPTWLPIGAYGMAIVALIGGFFIAYHQTSSDNGGPNYQKIGNIQQGIEGTGSNVAGVQGNVSVSVSGTAAGSRPARPSAQHSLTRDEVKSLISSNIDEALMVQAIQGRGVAFAMTPEFETSLRAMGASDGVIAALEKNRR